MANLVKDCYEIEATDMNINCNADAEVGEPVLVVLGKASAAITAVGDIPTPTEVQAYLTAQNGYMFYVTNGVVNEPTLQTKTGADTHDGQEKVTREDNSISVSIKKITNGSLRMFQQNTLNNDRMRLWWVDRNNRWHGGKQGFLVPHYIPNFSHAGYGEEALINKTFSWKRDLSVFNEISDPDADYYTITNNVTYVFSETQISTYVLGSVEDYQNITGWNKNTYPDLWFKFDTGTIKIYADSGYTTLLAHYTDGTGVITVTEDGGSNFGGTVTGNVAAGTGSIWKVSAVAL